MKNLIIFGAGGHAKVVIEAVRLNNQFERVVLVDKTSEIKTYFGVDVIGEDIHTLAELALDFSHAFVAIGSNRLRLEKTTMLMEAGFEVPAIIHPKAVISPHASVCAGSFVNAGAILNVDVDIGIGCIVNTGAIVDHDSVIADGVHISPGAVLGGSVRVETQSWICLGAKIINNISIGKNSIIAAGSVVISDIEDNIMAAGVPAVKKKVFI